MSSSGDTAGSRGSHASRMKKPHQVPSPQQPYQSLKPFLPVRSLSLVNQKPGKPLPSLSSPPMRTAAPYSASDGLRSRTSSIFLQITEKYMRHESIFEAFLVNAISMPLHKAVEETIGITLSATSVTMWQDIPSLHLLYSESKGKIVRHSQGLVGETFFKRTMLRAATASDLPAFSSETDTPNCRVLLFPLWDQEGNVCAVVEVTRDMKEPEFNDDDDVDFMHFFVKKFKIFSHWLFQSELPHDSLLELLQSMELEQFLLLFQRRVPALFDCRTAELWKYDMRSKKLTRYSRECTEIDYNRSGIAGESLVKDCPISCAVNRMQSSYVEEVDGPEAEPVLAVPMIDTKQMLKFAVVLRGKRSLPVFTSKDESTLRQISPYLALALNNNQRFSETSGDRDSSSRLCVEGLSAVIQKMTDSQPVSDILTDAVERLKILVNADRVYLFSLDHENECYKTIVATNCHPLSIPIDRGIVGATFRGTEVFNIPDAYADIRFDSSLDLDTGYRTRSLASIPVLDHRRQTVAVAQLLNRRDGKPFSNLDLTYSQVFCTLLGLFLSNESLDIKESTATKQLKTLVEVSLSLASSQNHNQILTELITASKTVIGADRASLFLLDESLGVLSTRIVDGGRLPQTIPLTHGLAATAAKTRQPLLVNDAYHDPRFNKMIDYHTGFRTTSILAAPVISSEGLVLGVVELVNKAEGFTLQDQSLFVSFAALLSISLETRRLRDVCERGTAELEISKWMADFERPSSQTPSRLSLPSPRDYEALSLEFSAIEWNGIGLFKVAFHIFATFSLLSRFRIPSDVFFTFLFRLREQYLDIPFHNWVHAVDTLQYVAYQARVSKIDGILDGTEMLALLVAAVCVDTGHDGLTNEIHQNTGSPLSVLFGEGCIMERYHLSLAIRVVAMEGSHIFRGLPDTEIKRVWGLVRELIAATDMAKHAAFIKNANDILDQGPVNLASDAHRLMAMAVIMKTADLSFASRPFGVAERWSDALSEEKRRTGEEGKGKAGRADAQVEFYGKICVPLFQLSCRIFPELDVNLNAVKGNMSKWQEISDREAGLS